MRTAFLATIFSALTLVFASNSFAAIGQSDLDKALYPHAAAVREAMKQPRLVATPAPIQVAEASTESRTCRALRRQMENASSAPGGQNTFPTFDAKGRSMMGRSTDFGYSDRAKFEARYLTECN